MKKKMNRSNIDYEWVMTGDQFKKISSSDCDNFR